MLLPAARHRQGWEARGTVHANPAGWSQAVCGMIALESPAERRRTERPPGARLPDRHLPAAPHHRERRRGITTVVRSTRAGLRDASGHSPLTNPVAVGYLEARKDATSRRRVTTDAAPLRRSVLLHRRPPVVLDWTS